MLLYTQRTTKMMSFYTFRQTNWLCSDIYAILNIKTNSCDYRAIVKMNIIPRTILYNSKHQKYATKYLIFTKEVGNLIPITLLNKTFSCLTCNNLSKNRQSGNYSRAQQISTASKSNLFDNTRLSNNALTQVNNNIIVNPSYKVTM